MIYKLIDRALKMVSVIMAIIWVFGVMIADSSFRLSMVLMIIPMAWYGILTLIANWPLRRRDQDETS